VVMACQADECADQRLEVFMFCLGFTVSRLGFDERGCEVNADDSVGRGGMRRVWNSWQGWRWGRGLGRRGVCVWKRAG
jgi:hypothetical protein